MVDSLRGMRTIRDKGGVVFDIYEDQFERFLDVFTHLKDTDSRIDFSVQKCSELPELVEEDGYGGESNWRGAGGNGNGNDGGYN